MHPVLYSPADNKGENKLGANISLYTAAVYTFFPSSLWEKTTQVTDCGKQL